MDELLLSVEEAARRISCGRSHLYELLRRGEIQSVRLGRSRRIPLEALVRFVADRIEAENGS